MLFIRNGRFWNTEYPVLILKKCESSLPTKSWTESAIIIFTTEFFSSAQSNVTSHNVSFIYQQKLKKTLSAWSHAPPLHPPPPPPGISWTLKLLCFGFLLEFFGIITDVITSELTGHFQ